MLPSYRLPVEDSQCGDVVSPDLLLNSDLILDYAQFDDSDSLEWALERKNPEKSISVFAEDDSQARAASTWDFEA